MSRPRKDVLGAQWGGTSKADQINTVGTVTTHATESIRGGAQAVPHYRDRHEEYELVTKDDLREIKSFGWLQQGLFGVGTFLFSGAFWLFWDLLAHQDKFEFTAWIGMCVVSMLAGIAVASVGMVLFMLRQKRLNKYFPLKKTLES